MSNDNDKTPDSENGPRIIVPDFEIEIEKIEVKAKHRKLLFSVFEISHVEDAKTPDYDASILEATDAADKYRHRHHVEYEKPSTISYTSLDVLQQLWGRPWDQFALNMTHALRPSYIRVVGRAEGMTADARRWRVSVHLAEDDRTIEKITQEVEVGCVGAKHGHGLYKYEIGEDPKPTRGYYNLLGLKRLKIK